MTVYTWQGTGTGLWGVQSNWNPTGYPNATGDTADFTGTTTYVAQIASGAAFTTGTVVLSDPNATFDLLGHLDLGTASAYGSLTITAGTLIIDSTSGAGGTSGRLRYGTVTDDGGTVTFDGGNLIAVIWQGTLDLSATNAFVKAMAPGGATTANDATIGLTLEGAGGVGNGTALVTGAGSQFGLLDYQTFNNATIDLGSSSTAAKLFVAESSNNTTGAAQVTLGSGIQIDSTGSDKNAVIASNTASDVFISQGTITAGAAGGNFTISAELTNQGTIQAEDGDTLTIKTDTLTNASTGTITVDATSSLQIKSTLQDQGGAITVTPGGIFNVTSTGTLQGYGTITGAVASSGAIIASGGTLEITGAVNGSTGADIAVLGDSTARIDGSVIDSDITFSASGTNEIAALGNLGGTVTTIHEFYAGDTIWLTNLDDTHYTVSASYSSTTGQLSITDNGAPVGTLTLAPPYTDPSASPSFMTTPDANGGTDITTDASPCYVTGTRILTGKGEVPVESLAIGDIVLTAAGEATPILWIGRRSYAGRFIAGQHLMLPVCIKRGALGAAIPHRDLWVSPGHAMLVDGQLVPAWRLINGVSVIQAEAVNEVTYYHIELDCHNILLANGAPLESFLDDGCRRQFHNAADFYARYPGRPAMTPYAPRLEDGFSLQAIQDRIAARAGLPWSAEPAGPLRGFIDTAGPGHVCGWAQDADNPEEPVALEVLAGDVPVLCVLANAYRADLRSAGLGSGCHAFAADLPLELSGAIAVRRINDGAVLGTASQAAAEVLAQMTAKAA